MGPLVVAAFLICCLLATHFTEIALTLCLNLFATKQLLQASANIFRDSQTGSQVINVLIGLVVAICATRRLFTEPARFSGFLNPTWYLIVSLFLWALCSCAWSYAGKQGLEAFGVGLPYLALFLLFVPLLITNMEDWCRSTTVWLVLTTCVAGMILINPEFTIRSGRLGLDLGAVGLKSSRTNPLELGAAGGFCVVLGALYTGFGRTRGLNLMRIISILVGTALAVRSGSRGQFLFAILTVIVVYPIAKPITDIRRTLTGLLTLGILLAAIVFLAERVRSSGSFEEEQRWSSTELTSGSDVRFANIGLLLGEYASSPLRWFTGLGFMSYSALDPVQEYSHCITADMLGELGLVGFVLFIALLLLSILHGVRIFRVVSGDARLRNGFGCLVGLLVYQFLLANKQGNLVGSHLLFGSILILARIQASLVAAEASDFAALADDPGPYAEELEGSIR